LRSDVHEQNSEEFLVLKTVRTGGKGWHGAGDCWGVLISTAVWGRGQTNALGMDQPEGGLESELGGLDQTY